ncbi:MAG: phosphotransferase [Candidatus Ruthia sp. Asou_11_S2]|nr:phosphotransferase [Candidatus Ruthia sp. Asou_11_S2]
MHDERLDKLGNWLENFFGHQNFALTSASDDASFRRYFRVQSQQETFIAMDAPPSKENAESFIKIAKLFNRHNIHAPKIISIDLKQGFLLLEDLGSTTFLQTLNGNFNLDLYKIAINELIKIQAINTQNLVLKEYDKQLLNTEMQLLTDWYLPKTLSNTHLQNLQAIFRLLSDNALNSKQVFVHRDYHCRNLMTLKDNDLGVIDFQDALIGSNTYDLCSLLKDAYFELQPLELQMLLQYYYDQANIDTEFSQFEKQFELMGLQRHLKILGIFKRLSIRDNKHQYLNDLPLVKKYAQQTANKYPELAALKEVLCLV